MDKELGIITAAQLTGVEVFLLLLSGQLGQLVATGKPIPLREIVSNLILNVVFTVVIVQLGAWQEWGTPQVLVLAGVVGVVGIQSTISFIKARVGKLQ